MNNLWITKYIPTKLHDIQYKETFVSEIKNLIRLDYLNLLFIGESGSGKSLLLKSIIHEYYEPNEMDEYVLTVNSLFDLNVVQCRNELKVFCQIKKLKKKKTVCIDDLDTMNEQNQQVIRNFIDKYSDSVNFLCACINIKKVVEPLYKRLIGIYVNHYQFEELYNILNKICISENINISEKGKEYIIKNSNASIRCLLSLLEKCKLYANTLNYDEVVSLSTNINYDYFNKYTKYIFKQKLSEAIDVLFSIYDLGYSVIDILDEYFIYIKIYVLDEKKKYTIIKALSKYISIFYDGHEHKIQLALFTHTLIKYLLKL